MKRMFVLLLCLLLISACSLFNNDPPHEKEGNEAIEAFSRAADVVATDLTIPWNITKHHDTFYLSERGGSVTKVDGVNGEKTIQQVILTKDVLHEGEGGLLGFILAPDFDQSNEAIAYHTYMQNGEIYNRIVLLRLNQNTWTEAGVLLEGIPGGRIHNGGRIKIGPDEKLYATTGDAGNPANAQNLNSLAGKILRMELNGKIPVDNPFPSSYVYSFGHRNPQGLDWDDNGSLYSSEHGQRAHDEINKIDPGKNYGWPTIEGDQQSSGMVSPIFQTGTTTWAPSGIEIRGNLMYIANLRGENIKVLNLPNLSAVTYFEDAGRMRDILIENGSLYTITNNLDGRGTPRENDDKLIKISFTE